MLAKKAETYGEVAASMGILYWYDYEGDGAKRIAQGWFQKAAEAGKRLPGERDWEKTARVYAHIGSYFESLSETGGNRNGDNTAFLYWEDTGELLETGYLEPFDESKQLLLYQSCVSRIIMDAGILRQMGVSVDQMQQRLDLLKHRTQSLLTVTEEERLSVEESIEEASVVLRCLV